MVKNIILSCLSLAVLASCNPTTINETVDVIHVDSLQLIPYPNTIKKDTGSFKFTANTIFEGEADTENEKKHIKNLLSDSYSESNKVKHIDETPTKIILKLIPSTKQTAVEKEEYSLTITQKEIKITGSTPTGVMHGIQTLRQLFIPAFYQLEKREAWYVPCVKITDKPAFEHRGLLLDVCRHFFGKEVILKYIDALAFYKMNVLHFHLTEDQGWRIPIEKYPLLNEISAWRTDTSGNQYGGFYTKKELNEIVAYATERHITIIPEVELPGHAQAALAAYPQFSCNGGPIEVINDWGVFKEIYCAGNDSTFTFIEDILTEVMEIFPSEYIHIGGDEAPKFRWEHCDKCQRRMKKEGLHNEHELQSYFITRIEQFLNKNGRKLIGWDEILEGGLSENAAVQSWRGMEGGMEAAKTKHTVIMSPTSHCYLDYGLSSIDLKQIYSFDPIPEELANEYRQYIIGGEANMWTEHVPNETVLDNKVFPRVIGLAEVLWSYKNAPDFNHFYNRLQGHYPILSSFGIAYGLETIGAAIEQEHEDSAIKIVLLKNLPNLDLTYRWQGNNNVNLPYESPIPLHKSGNLIVQAYKNGTPYGDSIMQGFKHHKGLNSQVTYATEYNKWYVGNADKHLVDGEIASIDFRDGNWQGFWGKDIDVTIDLGALKRIKKVSANFYQYANSWIFLPTKVNVQLSTDGVLWENTMQEINTKVDLSNKKSIHQFNCVVSTDENSITNARYLHFTAKNLGKVPDGHEAAGQDTWLFIDEIIIE